MWTEELFQVKKPVIALLHLRALPGDPLYDREGGLKQVVDIARRELHALQDGGVDGILFANEFSLPYQPRVDYVTVAAMARIIGELRGELRVPYGVNIAANPLAALELAVATDAGRAGITNPGFHGLSQVLYEYASSAANNGSGFEGLADNSYFWNITAGLAMFFGRYLSIVIQLAIAGSLMKKRFVNESAGTLRTITFSFAVILVFVVYIFAALTFFPALALGPIAEHLTLWG